MKFSHGRTCVSLYPLRSENEVVMIFSVISSKYVICNDFVNTCAILFPMVARTFAAPLACLPTSNNYNYIFILPLKSPWIRLGHIISISEELLMATTNN